MNINPASQFEAVINHQVMGLKMVRDSNFLLSNKLFWMHNLSCAVFVVTAFFGAHIITLTIMCVIYTVVLICLLWSFLVTDKIPVVTNWDNLQEFYIQSDFPEAMNQILSDLTTGAASEEACQKRLVRYVKVSRLALVCQMILLSFSIFVRLWSG